jgi:hypothetical protein
MCILLVEVDFKKEEIGSPLYYSYSIDLNLDLEMSEPKESV